MRKLLSKRENEVREQREKLTVPWEMAPLIRQEESL